MGTKWPLFLMINKNHRDTFARTGAFQDTRKITIKLGSTRWTRMKFFFSRTLFPTSISRRLESWRWQKIHQYNLYHCSAWAFTQLPNRGNGHAKRDGSAIQSGNCKTGRVHGHKDHRPDAELFPGLPVLDSNRPFLQRIAWCAER